MEPLQSVLRRVLILNQNALNEAMIDQTLELDAIMAQMQKAYMAYTMKYAVVFIASAPLLMAYPFVQKHFGGSKEEANATLKKLGIEDGLDGVNFSLSMLFIDSKGDQLSAGQDIVLVATYKVKIFQFFDWEVLEANLCKQAVCRAWLGGDDVQEYVDTTQTAVLPEGSETEAPEENPETPGENPDDGEQQPGEGTETPDEGDSGEGEGDSGSSGGNGGGTEEPKEEPPVDITGSYWYQDAFIRFTYFHNSLVTSKGLVSNVSTNYSDMIRGVDVFNRAYGFAQFVRYDKKDAEGKSLLLYSRIAYLIKAQEDLYTQTNGKSGFAPGKVKEFIYVVYVPDNMKQEDIDKLKTAIESCDYMLNGHNEELGMDISVTVRVEKRGGNYDYSKEGA